MQKIIEVKDGVARHPLYRFKQPVNFEVCQGEHIAIVGPNGGGKSMLVDILTGAHALQPMNDVKYDFRPSKAKMVSDNIKHMTFRDSYGIRTTLTKRLWLVSCSMRLLPLPTQD
jgi:molybdate transport system ATP-binding protein